MTQTATPTVLDVLMTAKKILSNPKRWTKYHARDERDGETCYCALGAIYEAAGLYEDPTGSVDPYLGASNRLRTALPGTRFSVPMFNDDESTTHTDVMQVFSDAIDREIAENGGVRAQIPAVEG